MDTNLPKVSIVLPTYNGAKYIRHSIDSCLNQTYKNIELIIVDDCSTDETPNIIMFYNDPRIKYIRHWKNMRLPAALNTGFAKATGYYFTWISDDNYFCRNAIEKLVNVLKSDTDIDIVYSKYNIIYENGCFKLCDVGEPHDLLKHNTIGPCFLYKRKIYELLGGFSEGAFLCEDYEYWLRIYFRNFKFIKISEPLYFYRMHSNNLSAKKYVSIRKMSNTIRRNYIINYGALNRKTKGSLFLEIARETYYQRYIPVCIQNLCLSLLYDPFIFIRNTSFIKLFIKLIIGIRIAERL